jgi:hypothetical protein
LLFRNPGSTAQRQQTSEWACNGSTTASSRDNQKKRHKIVAKLTLLHNDDSLPTVSFASDVVKILTQIVAL